METDVAKIMKSYINSDPVHSPWAKTERLLCSPLHSLLIDLLAPAKMPPAPSGRPNSAINHPQITERGSLGQQIGGQQIGGQQIGGQQIGGQQIGGQQIGGQQIGGQQIGGQKLRKPVGALSTIWTEARKSNTLSAGRSDKIKYTERRRSDIGCSSRCDENKNTQCQCLGNWFFEPLC